MKNFGMQAAISFLFGMLGAIIVVIIVQCMHKSEPTIATVHLTQLVDQFIKEERKKNISQPVLDKEIKQFGEHLEATLHQLASKHNLILLPKEAVISHVPDVTDEVRPLLRKG